MIDLMTAIEIGHALLGFGVVGFLIWVCVGLTRMEKETMALIKQLESKHD